MRDVLHNYDSPTDHQLTILKLSLVFKRVIVNFVKMFESVPDLQRAVGDAVGENDQPTSFSFFQLLLLRNFISILVDI